MKLVSIVIPTYGGGDYLVRSVKSVLNQDYQNIEVIVVDDNGIDTENQIKTQEHMEKFKNDKRVKYVLHEKNINGAAARNTGAKTSKGDYISFLDDDDIYLPNNISTQLGVLGKLDNSWGMTYCSHKTYLNGKYVETVNVKKSGYLLYEILLHKVIAGSSSLLIRREVFESVNGFDESFKRHQDWEFTARVASRYKIHKVENIGFQRNLMFRNNPKDLQEAKEYRNYYLVKMMPLIQTFSNRKKKKIILSNKLSLIYKYLRTRQFKIFIKEYKEINCGLYGICLLFISTINYIFSKFVNGIKSFFVYGGTIE